MPTSPPPAPPPVIELSPGQRVRAVLNTEHGRWIVSESKIQDTLGPLGISNVHAWPYGEALPADWEYLAPASIPGVDMGDVWYVEGTWSGPAGAQRLDKRILYVWLPAGGLVRAPPPVPGLKSPPPPPPPAKTPPPDTSDPPHRGDAVENLMLVGGVISLLKALFG